MIYEFNYFRRFLQRCNNVLFFSSFSFFVCVHLCYLKPRPNDRNMSTQHIATLLGATCCARLATMLRHVGCCWLKFDNTQHVATRRNMVAKREQHVAPNNVAMCCVDMLRSFGRGLRINNISTRCFRNRRYLFRYLAQSQY